MGRIFVAVGGVLVLVLMTALVAPYFVDWTGYRASFEREASKVLGRPVTVAGDASARLLPFPSVTFSDVRVGDPGSAPVMTIDKFSMDAELAPFIRGEVLIFDMRLERPSARINVDEAGRVNWALRPNSPFNASQIALENVSITDGSVSIHDATTDRVREISDLDAVVSAGSLAGPWKFDGNFAFNGERVGLVASTGEVQSDGRLNLRMRVSPETLPVTFDTDGGVVVDDGHLTYAGQIGFRAAETAKAPAKVLREGQNGLIEVANAPKTLLSELRVTGKFEANHNKLDIAEFRMEQGTVEDPYIVNGNAMFDFGQSPHFQITADGQQVMLGGNVTEEASQSAVPLTARISAFRSLLDRIPIPTVPGAIDLKLPAIIAGDTTIRSVVIDAAPGDGNWTIRQLTADLPGRTQIEAKGTLFIGEDFGFDGDLLLASRQPSGFASWLTSDVDEAIRRLPGAGISGKVSLRDDAQTIDNLELSLGGASLQGSFSRTSRGDSLPFMKLALEGGALDGDGLEALVSLIASDSGVPRLENHDLDVSLKAGPVSHGGLKIGALDTAFRLREGQFDIDRLIVDDIAGTTLTATGTVKPFGNEPTGSFDATLLSPDLTDFLSAMATRFPQATLFKTLSARAASYPGLFTDSRLNIFGAAVSTSEKPSEFSLSASGVTGGMDLGLSGTAKGMLLGADPLEINMAVNAKAPEGERLLALLGMPVLPLGLAGALDGNLEVKGTLASGMQTQLKLIAPDGQALVDGSFTLKDDVLAGIGRASLKAQDIEPFLAALGYGVAGFGSGLPTDLTTSFQIADSRIALPDLAGKIDDTAVSAKLNAGLQEGVPDIRGEAKVASVDLASAVSFMLGPDALLSGRDQWSSAEFFKTPAFPIIADIALTTDGAFAGPFGRIEGFKGKIDKSLDTLRIADMSGKLNDGTLNATLELRNSNGAALVQSQIKLADMDIASLYTGEGEAMPLSGKINLAASLNATGTSVAALMASAAGSGVLTSNEITLTSFNPMALSDMIAAVDKEETGVTPDRLEQIVDDNLGEGSLKSGAVEVAFTLAGGIGRVPAFSLLSDDASFSSELRFSLPDMTISSEGTFAFHAGRESIAGAEPVVGVTVEGPYRAPDVNVNRQPLVQFLTQRSLEREQQRVEAMQMALVEKQRLRREARLYQSRIDERARIAEELRLQEEARKKAEEEARLAAVAAENARLEAERVAAEKKAEEEAAQRAAAEKQLLQQAPMAIPAPNEPERTQDPTGIPAPNEPPSVQGTPLEDGLSVDQFLKDLQLPAP